MIMDDYRLFTSKLTYLWFIDSKLTYLRYKLILKVNLVYIITNELTSLWTKYGPFVAAWFTSSQWWFSGTMFVYQRVIHHQKLGCDVGFRRQKWRLTMNKYVSYQQTYNVRPPRYLSLFIAPITMVFGTYNYSYWGL